MYIQLFMILQCTDFAIILNKRSTKQTDTCKILSKCNGSNLSISKEKLRAAKNLYLHL